ncbi:glycosyltransferase family 1 protein [Microbacterium sp. SS28]|uniref:glycosyltransferase family 4 protein n=1 Tax=Microbacterium sp. SS28 TaxID=2919948 RepID=UPI001FA97E21|nr:glycosyltransferase family 1 protein [Microbacterium sp. SS28]
MLTLVPGAMGGSETYSRELTRQLKTTDRVRATAFVPSNAAGFSEGIPEVVVTQVRTGSTAVGRLGAIAAANVRRRSLATSLRSADVVHFPFTIPSPRPARSQAFVQTLLDVQHLDLPQLFGRAELAFRRHFYEGAARRADAVITISEFARTRMIEQLRIPADRVHVAHLGVDVDSFIPNTADREDFVLYPARGWKHKNHARLVEAMRAVRADRPEMRLVLTGGGLDSLGELPDWVEVRGLVSSAELRALYRSAAVLAFPSLYEGFGLPPLEAMASGCPVAATDAGSVPEVCGDAAVLFDAGEPAAIAAGILTALERSGELTRKGLEQVRMFTWERCRDVHVDVYRAVA